MPRILLVEDNELNREMLSRRLLRKGFEVALAVDGLQGVALAASERPDLVLMDMSLPGIDGWEATRRIKADPATRALPVIALTAHAMAEDRAKALAAGCDEFDTKPVQLDRLLDKIGGLLGAVGRSAAPAAPELPTAPAEVQALGATELTLPAHPDSLPAFQAALDALCALAGASADVRADLQVVLDELCSNIIRHALPDGLAPGAGGDIGLTLRLLPGDDAAPADRPARIQMTVRDQGQPFNPLVHPEPALSPLLDERPLGGLGLHLVRQLTDAQHYSHTPGQGNCLSVFKRL